MLPAAESSCWLQWGHGDEAVEESPPPGPFRSKGLRTGFARGLTRGGVKPIASSGDEVVKSKGNGLWAQREAHAGLFRANILIANELWPGCGLFNISAPHRSRFKGQQKPRQPAGLSRYTERGERGDLRVATAYSMLPAGRKSPRPKWHEWPTAMGPVTIAGNRSRKAPRDRCPPSSPRLRR